MTRLPIVTRLPWAVCFFLALLASALLVLGGCGSGSDQRVVLYCALDREFAEVILRDFQDATGLEVVPRFDAEANKSVGLIEDLLREAGHPRCDVHWNNEILGTLRLQKAGVLASYASPSGDPFAESWKATDRTWHAFAARARVILVNTRLVPREQFPKSWHDLTQPQWARRLAMAKPQFGTTATQAACLFQAWGMDKASDFYRKLRGGVQIVPGNKQVAEGVGRGDFALGLTDTDDAMAEVEAGRPVALVFPDRDAPADSLLGTLLIPNTVALIKGGPNPEGGKKLIDYLLGPEVEKKLSRGPGRQIPLNPQVQASLPEAMRDVATARPLPVDFARAAQMWHDVQTFLTREFARP